MIREMFQAKLHRVRVTGADLNYEGSCGIDQNLLVASGILPNQKVAIYNVTTGDRFSTYAIKSPPGSGEICLNGAAARKASVGDIVIIVAYSLYTEDALKTYRPVVIQVDEGNQPRS